MTDETRKLMQLYLVDATIHLEYIRKSKRELSNVKSLEERGVSYNSLRMRCARKRYERADRKRKLFEANLRDKLGIA